jgi:hypothetical protein
MVYSLGVRNGPGIKKASTPPPPTARRGGGRGEVRGSGALSSGSKKFELHLFYIMKAIKRMFLLNKPKPKKIYEIFCFKKNNLPTAPCTYICLKINGSFSIPAIRIRGNSKPHYWVAK